jgi:2-dehydropantoate 2-reductase
MRFVIVGPGAMGTIFGAALARGGHDVTWLGRPSHRLEAATREGLRVRSRDGTVEKVAAWVTDDPTVVADAEVLIVLVKAGDTTAAMTRIRAYLPNEAIVLTLQNGLGNAKVIRQALGDGPRILPGITSQAATRVAPDTVVHAGEGPTFIGYENVRDASISVELASILSEAGLPAFSVPDIDRWIWQKVAVNAAINGLTALGGTVNGAVANDPDLLDAAETVAEEAASVARAHGYELGSLRRAVRDTAMATAENRSSMLQDIEAGRPTEVDAIHGAILNAGAEVGIATPAIGLLAALIRAKTREAMKEESDDG